MGFHIVNPDAPPSAKAVADKDKQAKTRNGNTRPLPLPFPDLHQCGRLRTGHLLTVFGVSAPEFYKRQKGGLLPAPDGRDPRPYWEASTIRKFKESGGGAG
ncbi:hypothetical protein [Paraburkholderia sp. GAS348]|uniref:hypothetical protein n=1 Tax=Paraburkholderia sp. GAS348 TaxID=3035132 RepID=UPI003D218A80